MRLVLSIAHALALALTAVMLTTASAMPGGGGSRRQHQDNDDSYGNDSSSSSNDHDTSSGTGANDNSTPNSPVTVDLVTLNGSGCAPGTAVVAVAPGNVGFTVTYSNFIVTHGPGTNAMDARKNCQANVIVNVPSGYTYAITKATYRGFAQLMPGVTLTESANFYFQGDEVTSKIQHQFTSINNHDWQATDDFSIDGLVFAPCGAQRNLNINTSLFLSGVPSNGQQSIAIMDSTDFSVSSIYRFYWKKC